MEMSPMPIRSRRSAHFERQLIVALAVALAVTIVAILAACTSPTSPTSPVRRLDHRVERSRPVHADGAVSAVRTGLHGVH
jgi:hypothetical protein